ncbi:alpha/beta-hydrolase [Polyplosphaeria fusca]|uniref:Alpha/beta-hydrolase n=1 Tax=Polyplosphaeria fusca TaxID=682080 RepID=A0A9P4RCJ0_9PLEO|nr:alpha/beta-hydrolase [Polyplosphaeria fusca]
MYFLKLLHVAFYIVFTLLRIPLWALYFLFPSLRQHPQWTYRQALRVRLFRTFLYVVARIRPLESLSLEPGKEGPRFTVMQPAHDDAYTSILRCDNRILPTPIGGTWYPSPPPPHSHPPSTNTPLILHFHGGGFVLGNARPSDCGSLSSLLLSHTPATHILCPAYRLSSYPSTRFPASAQDALTAYLYLLRTLHIPPTAIVLSGDSAGGHLVICLLRYIAQFGTQLDIPPPRAAWLWSPWCDVATPMADPGVVYASPQYATDFLPDDELVRWTRECWVPAGETGVRVEDPYVSPLGHAFVAPCRVFAMVGGAELNFKEVTRWCGEMGEVKRNEVRLWVEEKAPHDILKCGGIMGFEEEAARAVEEAWRFTKEG